MEIHNCVGFGIRSSGGHPDQDKNFTTLSVPAQCRGQIRHSHMALQHSINGKGLNFGHGLLRLMSPLESPDEKLPLL